MKTLLEKLLASYAIVNRGFDQVNLRGSVGAVTYRRVGGETIASQKVPAKQTYKPTYRLALHRMLWPNLVSLFRLINVVGWHPSFMGKAPRVSDFNEFMARNASNPATRVFLTRSQVQAGTAIVAPVEISSGDLPAIQITFDDENVKLTSNIRVEGLTIGSSTTVRAFSLAIINNNSDWLNKDQITIVTLKQQDEDAFGNRRIVAEIGKIILDTEDDVTTLDDLKVTQMLTVSDGYLGIGGANLSTMGAAFVHSRDVVGGETRVSTQSLVMNGSIPSQYTNQAAFLAAIDSYGGVRGTQYLTPSSGIDEVLPAD